MKKAILGCLGVSLIVALVGGIGGYWFVVKPFWEGLSSLKEINQANEEIENQESYEPPETGELKAEQVERFVAVQKEIRSGLEGKIAYLEEEYGKIEEEANQVEPSLGELFGFWKEGLNLYAEAKKVQIDALNEHGFSLEEYQYVQRSFYQALGLEIIPYDLDSLANAASQEKLDIELEEFEIESKDISEETLKRNRELVTEYATEEEAGKWLPFAYWGI